MSQHRVLVVDDEPFFRELIADVLASAVIPHVSAATAAEAQELAADPQIGVVILDLELPDQHGLELFRKLKQTRPDLRVVILSASTQEQHVLEALRLGAFDYLAKPLHEEELLLSVRRALETFGIASGWQRLKSRVERLQDALGELWARARAAGADDGGVRELAVSAASEVLGAARTSLLLLDEGAAELRVVAAHGSKLAPEEMDAVPLGQGVAGLAHARGEPLLVVDVGADERFAMRRTAGTYASSSFAVAPLVAGARTLGVLCATERPGGSAFDAEDLALLRIIAGQLAHMLQAPLLLEAEPLPSGATPPDLDVDFDAVSPPPSPYATDPTLLVAPAPGDAPAPPATDGPRNEDLAREICDAVTAEVEPARVLEAALAPIASALGAAPVSIYLRDYETGELVREAENDGSGRRSDRPRLSPTSGLTGSVLSFGLLVATDDPTADPRFQADTDTPEGGTEGPMLCGALRFRGKPIGVFRAFPESPGRATPELGELLSAALSAAVRNVILYRSLVETIEEVAEARRAARVNPQSPEPDAQWSRR